ncbi:STN domain-containing protein [Erwiniaceae bacterium L1_54_6]|jgi:hypothetical protein|nr:STN domain-containing protein [Erwiniaceae bacterium L1_54_6]
MTKQTLKTVYRKLRCAGIAFLIVSCSAAPSVHTSVGKCDAIADYDISFSRFGETAQQLAHGTGCFIRTDLNRTAAVRVNPVKGRMTIREALHMAVAGTGLKVTEHQADSMTVR